jgi:hypothetical protein
LESVEAGGSKILQFVGCPLERRGALKSEDLTGIRNTDRHEKRKQEHMLYDS